MEIEINKTYSVIENGVEYQYLILEIYGDGSVLVLCDNKTECEIPYESLTNCKLKY